MCIMSKLHVNHIKSFLENTFSEFIDIADLSKKCKEEQHKNMLSRALAAYAISILAPCSAEIASRSIIDGYDDNGVDAIFFDKVTKSIWIVQSKFIESGNGGIDNGDVLKFIAGMHDLIDLRFDRFNEKIKVMSNDIIEALNDPFVKIQIVFAYTGSQLSSHNIQTINDFLEELNDTSELAYFTDFNLNQAHKGLLGGIDGSPINVDITLSNWGQIEEPYNAIYGQISGVDLAHWWITYKRKLFSENIRYFLGSSDVNEEITNTIKNEPQNFIFYNNGITVLCDKIRKKPVGGSDKTIGAFICEGISIVNGAQTLGTIGSYFTSRLEEESPLKVFVKFISLENAPVGLAEKITIATNTQNKVDKKDFISLDSEQERLKTELALEGICYHYKRTDEKIILDENNYSLEEATLSLATFNPDVTLTVQAKREIGKLWEDRTRKPYTDLFNANLSATRLSRSILVYRKVLSSLRERIMASNGREKGIYIYGNLFIAHMVFQSIPQHILEDYSFDFTQYQENQVLSLISDMILLVKDKVEELYPNSMIPQMFRNFSKCRHIKSEIENL